MNRFCMDELLHVITSLMMVLHWIVVMMLLTRSTALPNGILWYNRHMVDSSTPL